MSTSDFVLNLRSTLGWLSLAALLVALGCGGDDGSTTGVGDDCNVEDESACPAHLVCAAVAPDSEQTRCQIPAGGECDMQADDPGCLMGTGCVVVGQDEDDNDITECRIAEAGACDPDDNLCDPALACEQLEDDSHACHKPFVVQGDVIDSADETGIEGAHVIALDDEKVAVTDIAVSDAGGVYELWIPAVRDADGAPLAANYTLRASADGYQTFPGGLRTALPINTTEAVEQDDGWIFEGTLSRIVLIEVEDPDAPRVTISGHVVAEGHEAGVLVVAESGDAVFSAVSDLSGAYTIFNVTPGEYRVKGYAVDLQLTPASATAVDEDLADVDLVRSDAALTTVSGSLEIVDTSAERLTSVILVVESTFDSTFERGEVPRGLRAPRTGEPSISGDFTIEGVPDGSYVVLAAFENDLLVRDPDTNIAGTDFVTIQTPPASGTTLDMTESFKVTEALGVISPGAETPEQMTSAPMLTWADDASEEWYEVQVFDAFGNLVWEDLDVPAVTGPDQVAVAYEGPMQAGMYYQFRATSWRSSGGTNPAPISTTEDLRGVFFVQP